MNDVQSIAQMAQHLQQPDGSDHEASDTNARKRKADDEGNAQTAPQRARRNRYVSIACNECKRRKIKCNGQSPCQRCGNLSLECVYAPNCCSGFRDSQEYKDMSAHISFLQEQVNSLFEGLNALRSQIGREMPMQLHPGVQTQPQAPQQQQQQQQHTPIDPSLQSTPFLHDRASYPGLTSSSEATPATPSSQLPRPKSSSQSQPHTFRGPTSTAFNIGVAKHSLQSMGITSNNNGDDGMGGADSRSPDGTPERTLPRGNNQLLPTLHRNKDPIWRITQDEAIRLCKLYDEEMGLMYPIVDIAKVITYTKRLYSFMDAARRSGLMQQGFPGPDSIDDDDTNILKMILALGMVVEGCGLSDLGQKLYEYVQPAIDNSLLGSVGIKGIRLLTMTAMYEFHRLNEGTSWRIIGLAARLCIELGLHRHETYDAMRDEVERNETIMLFWAVYNLDRRWSFGTGMPFALQDSDLDPLLPKPDRSVYLTAMSTYSIISAKVWRSVHAAQPSNGNPIINIEDMNYLDYQVVQWRAGIPAHFRLERPSQAGSSIAPDGAPSTRGEHRLRILLYLRGNQMRVQIYLPVLHLATTIMQYSEQAQKTVDIAKDTIRILTHVNQTTDLYRTQQSLFNAMLTSALAVLFLAVSHAPAMFSENVREEFHMALDLVRGFSKGSWVSKRLWKTIRGLKEIGQKLGLPVKDPTSDRSSDNARSRDDMDPSRSAAVAMAGLAGHNVDETSLYDGSVKTWSVGSSGANASPERMASDLTNLFEVAGGYQNTGDNSAEPPAEGSFPASQSFADYIPDGLGDDGLANILRQLF